MREDVIKQLADTRIGESTDGTIINFGATHVQKARLFRTDIEWLGEYLVHRSTVVHGSVFVIGVMAASILPVSGGTVLVCDVHDASPPNELLRVMVESFPDQTMFLPLDDPVFASAAYCSTSRRSSTAAPRRSSMTPSCSTRWHTGCRLPSSTNPQPGLTTHQGP